MIDSKTAGSRYATRVQIESPAGSVYGGRRGTLVEIRDGTAFVRLTIRFVNITVPFALSEIKEIKS